MRYSPETRRLDWLIVRPIAHRGFHNAAKGIVENTSSAFAAAIERNYAIECDVQLSADGEAMVFHDHRLDRVADASGPLITRTARELKAVRLKVGSDRMQTLGDLLDQVAGRVPLVIEIKSSWNGNSALAARTIKVLARYAGAHAVMSFDPDIVDEVRFLSPSTVRGIVADRVTDRYYDHLPLSRRLEMRQFSHIRHTAPHFVSFEAAGLPYAPVGRMRAAGLPVICWTIRSSRQAAEALRYSDQITFEGFSA